MGRLPVQVFVAVWILILPACGIPRGEPLPPVENKISLTIFQKLAMTNLARRALDVYPDFEKLSKLESASPIPETGGQPIFVSVFHKAKPMIWGVGLEGDSRRRLLKAVLQIMENPDYAAHYLVNRERNAIKIDILTRLTPVKLDKRGKGSAIEPGVHGLVLQKGEQLFFQLPTDYLTLGWESEKTRGRRRRKLRMLAELSRQAGVASKGWRNLNLYRFRTLSFLQEAPDYAPVKLYRGRAVISRFSAQDLQDAALQIGRHLLNHVEATGRFRSRYDPIRNETVGWLDYDAADHAGALYSLSILFQYSKRLEIIDQTKPPLFWLIRHMKTPLMEDGATGVSLFGTATLPATAMTLLALTKMPKLVMERLGAVRVNRLAAFLTLMQKEDGGFLPTYHHKLLGWAPKKVPSGLDGLGLLALAEYYRVNPNVEWLRAAKRAAQRGIRAFEAGGKADPWTVRGLASLWKSDPDPRYADACLRMADQLVEQQYTRNRRPYADYIGGFDNARPPNTLSAAQRTQALVAAAAVAEDRGIDSKKYRRAVLRAAGFLLNAQVNKRNSYYLTLPEENYGALRNSPVDNALSLDAMSQGLAALCMAFDVQTESRVEKKKK